MGESFHKVYQSITCLSILLQRKTEGDKNEQESLHFTTIQNFFSFPWTLCFYMYFLPNTERMIYSCLRYMLYKMEKYVYYVLFRNQSLVSKMTWTPHEKKKIIHRLNIVMKAEDKILLEILSAGAEDALNNSKSFLKM